MASFSGVIRQQLRLTSHRATQATKTILAMTMTASSADDALLDKFRGAMVGAVVGDALGAPLEFVSDRPLPAAVVGRHFAKLNKEERAGVRHYTDDTAMARQLADSLIAVRGIDQWDLARRFSAEYLAEPHRGYGKGAADVLAELGDMCEALKPEEREGEDPAGPAARQFDGSGSYGNGAAMRAHPVALHCHRAGAAPIDRRHLAQVATGQAHLTHSNRHGVNGAVLQAYAVALALRNTDGRDFLKALKDLAKDTFDEEEEKAEGDDKEASSSALPDTFSRALDLMEECLEQKDDTRAQNELGNDVTALHSVPAAIYSALRGRDEQEGSSHGPFERTLILAYSFGGDTDTIGSMAGAIAGAFCGESAIPSRLARQCEAVDDARRHADLLHAALRNRSADAADQDDAIDDASSSSSKKRKSTTE